MPSQLAAAWRGVWWQLWQALILQSSLLAVAMALQRGIWRQAAKGSTLPGKAMKKKAAWPGVAAWRQAGSFGISQALQAWQRHQAGGQAC